MQQLQTTVLNEIQPGSNPIFIVSPNKNDGDELAILLSYYLEVTGSNMPPYQNVKRNRNYFSSPETQELFNLTENNKFRNVKDDKDKIDFIFSKDFDNGILWGLQSSYQSFFQLELYNLHKNSFFIILYGTPATHTMRGISEYELLDKTYKFYLENQQNAILFHVNNISCLEQIILHALPIDIRTLRIYPGINDFIYHEQTLQLKPYIPPTKDTELKKLYGLIDKENFIAKNKIWYYGNEILAILITNYLSFEDLLIKKIQQLAMSFLSYPTIYVICKNDADSNTIKKIAYDNFPGINIKIIACEDNFSPCINEIINNTDCKNVIIDNLNLSYSFLQILLPFKNRIPPVFNYGSILANKIINISSGKLLLADILTTRIILDNIAFEKSTWERISGFDFLIGDEVILWDFCIRSLMLSDSYALESNAIYTNRKNQDNITPQILNEANYSAVIEKHKKLYGANLNQVLKLVSENQHIPQNEIINLTHKITKLDISLNHSKEEVRSLNDFSNNLQNRIKILEGSRFYRWSERFRHYKKIFFKEKTPGKGTLKRILEFVAFVFTKAGFKIARKFIKGGFRRVYLFVEDRPVKIIYLDDEQQANSALIGDYNAWINKKLEPSELRKEYDSGIKSITVNPKISIIMPVYNPPLEFLKAAIESVINQLYGNWELCIADDCSPNPQVKRLINSYTLKDNRIKAVYRQENGHISACSNSALELVTGDYVFCLDHDDLITANCVYEVVKRINDHPDDQIIYSDEDKIDDDGIFSTPYFKPDWAPDNLMAKNYITHITVYKKQLIDALGGYRLGFEGSQDYDLVLRGTEIAGKNIGHIPKVLYHWRIHKASAAQQADVKPYAFFAAKKALEEALVRRNTPGEVQYLPVMMGYRVKYKVSSFDKVSIIIPTKDHAKLTQNTIDSIISLTSYPNYEIIVINNNSNTKDFFELMDGYKQKHSDIFRCIDASFPFNFAKLMNLGVAHSNGKYVLLLNNDVEVTEGEWLTTMVSFAQQERIGAVGVKLLYPDDKIQHAGTVIGLGGVAGHVLVNFYKDDPGYFNYLQSTTNYSAVTAACLMCRKDVYEEAGGMDEQLEVEFNDVDFCLSVMDHGHFNIYVPDVVLYHFESATRGHPHQNKESYERHLKECGYFLTKWEKYIKNDPFYNPNLRYDVQDFRVNYNA